MKTWIAVTLGITALLPDLWTREARGADRPVITLRGELAHLSIDLAGGGIVDFHLLSNGINPLKWEGEGGELEPRNRGHFLCLDRVGRPSAAEQANGMPFHGEAGSRMWELLGEPERQGDAVVVEMSTHLPLAGMHVRRVVKLEGAHFSVHEEVTNNNALGRIYNIVQHPTIGPPFLDESTLVDANARKGFMLSSPMPNPEEPSVYWPQALDAGIPVDMRRLVDDEKPPVVVYVIDDEYGWTTATAPGHGLLLGYLWKTAEYPWFRAWRHIRNGRPFARGLEFGTTGPGTPFGFLVEKGRIFDRTLFDYIDAGETISRSYAAFLVEVPSDFAGVERVDYNGTQVELREWKGKRRLSLEIGSL